MTDIYIPAIAASAIDEPISLMVGIQGEPGTGKSASSLTFPNPLPALFDKPHLKGILSLPHLAEVRPSYLPFYDGEWVKSKFKLAQSAEHKFVDRATAFKKFLREEGIKLSPAQTLIVDSWSSLQDSFDEVNWAEKKYGKDGKEDVFAYWQAKIDYAAEVHTLLKNLQCNVVVLFHEQKERDKATGQLLDKIQPLMQGKYVTRLKEHYSNFFRQRVREIVGKDGKTIIENGEKKIEYIWQTRSTDKFDAKCSIPGLPGYIEANYKNLTVCITPPNSK